jgi:hypothetical protein
VTQPASSAVKRRPLGRLAFALVFAVLGGGAWVQTIINLFSHGESPAVAVLHVLIAISGTAAAIGAWTMAGWAWIAALGYGAATIGLLLSLPSLIKLDPSAVSGLRTGEAAILIFTLWVAWYLRRTSVRWTERPG